MLSSATTAEDEIDWDEDEKPSEPAAAVAAAGGPGPVPTPIAVPNQKVAIDPSTTEDLKVTKAEEVPKAADEATTSKDSITAETAPAAEAPKPDFSIGLEKSDAEKEAEKRAARAKRFGIKENEEAKKLTERAKKFGLDKADPVVAGLDAALPDRAPKRGREGRQGGDRPTKRRTPDRRTAPKQAPKAAPPVPAVKKQPGRIQDDPTEKAKAEARAKRFAKPAVA